MHYRPDRLVQPRTAGLGAQYGRNESSLKDRGVGEIGSPLLL